MGQTTEQKLPERGFLYSSSNRQPEIDGDDVTKEVVSGTEIGVFSKSIKGLTGNTPYYYRAYAINTVGTSYGDVESFTTPAWISANIASAVRSTSASITCTISYGVPITVIERGIIYTALDNNTLEIGGDSVIKRPTAITGTDTFTINIAGLTGSTKYYYRVYVKNIRGTVYYDDKVQFTTPRQIVTGSQLTSPEVSAITSTSATFSGNIGGEGTIAERGIVYSREDNTPEIGENNVIKKPAPEQAGVVTIYLTGLTASTEYYYRAYTTNNVGANTYGDIGSFYTAAATLSNEDFEKTGISISPNPTTGILNITILEKTSYKLLDINGKTLKKGTLTKGNKNINLSYLAKGIYLLKLDTNKKSFTKRVVKQ